MFEEGHGVAGYEVPMAYLEYMCLKKAMGFEEGHGVAGYERKNFFHHTHKIILLWFKINRKMVNTI